MVSRSWTRRLISAISVIMSISAWRACVVVVVLFTSAVTVARFRREPDVQLGLELVDRHRAALDEIAPQNSEQPPLIGASTHRVLLHVTLQQYEA